QLIKDNQLNNSDVIYVGDETRDIRSARKSNVGIVAVGWGFNSAEILQEYQPDYLIYQPQELLDAINCYYLQSTRTIAK
ncbi:MAG: HAD hydrolase-like protein, partial [Waterburya sp.]